MKTANGFTLVELLAAMVAGSLLLASLSWTVSTLGRQLPIAEDAANLERLESLAPVLAGLLERIQAPTKNEPSFAGTSGEMSAIIPPPEAAGAAGPLRMLLKVHPSGAGQALIASLVPIQPGSSFPPRATGERLLIDGFRKIEFSYGPASSRPDRLPHLPRSISIAFTGDDGIVRRVTAIPRLNSDGRCRFDPISMSCR